MAFRELAKGLKLPQGASDRYRQLDALGRMLSGELYDDLQFSFDDERYNGKHIPLRERRPSVDLCLAYEITQDTMSELFGDEQFPSINVLTNREQDDNASEELSSLIDEVGIAELCCEAYEEGVIGSAAVVIRRSDEGTPFYEVLPGKWCEPVYRSQYSNELLALVVTYPVNRKATEKDFPSIVKEDPGDNYWYRYIIGPMEIIDYMPMSESKFSRLGEIDSSQKRIEFKERQRATHGFDGRVPAIFVKNLGGKSRKLDGQALWWPIRNICVEIDYTLSQCSRGLRYCADPMIFIKRGDLMTQDLEDNGDRKEAMMAMATNSGPRGEMVRGATQVLMGGKDSDAKILEIAADGIREEREFVRDLRELALEIVGGQKARAEHMKGAPSGRALDKGLKPLRRLVRRQRRPYGNGLLLGVVDLTLYGYRTGLFDRTSIFSDVSKIPKDSRNVPEWPNDDVLQGDELFQHVQGLQMAAGGSVKNPKELLSTDAVGGKLAQDLGFHQPYGVIKGSGKASIQPGTESGSQSLVTP